MPWLAAILLLAGLGGILWFVRQRREAPAGAPAIDIARLGRTTNAPNQAEPPTSRRVPEPSPPARRSEPASKPPIVPGGIVSTGLRPQLDAVLIPADAFIDENGMSITVDIILANVGSAPARDITIDARLMNAGPRQDEELARFLGAPRPPGDKIPLIDPQQSLEIRTTLRIDRKSIDEYKAGDHIIFAPMIGVVTYYAWSGGKEAVAGAGYLVGRNSGGSDRLAPFRTDIGARRWSNLASRRYEKGVRT